MLGFSIDSLNLRHAAGANWGAYRSASGDAPSLVLDFARQKFGIGLPEIAESTLAGALNFQRASEARYTGPDGTLLTAAPGVPRLDHDPVSGAALGLLIEDGRTNLISFSEDFANGAWSLQAGTAVSADAAPAPDASMSADGVALAIDGAQFLGREVTLSAGQEYQLSVYLKAGSSNWAGLALAGPVAQLEQWTFDLGAGSLGNALSGGGSARIVPAGAGWYRCILSVAAAESGNWQLRLYPAGSATDLAGLVGDGVFAWGAQLEAGTFPTSYIPTGAGSATRAGEATSVNLGTWYDPTRGTVYFDGRAFGSTVSDFIFTAGGSARFLYFSDTSLSAYDGGSILSLGTISYGAYFRAASAWSSADGTMSGAFNGGASVEPSDSYNGNFSTVTGKIDIGANEFSGHIRQLRYYPMRLSGPDTVSLTA